MRTAYPAVLYCCICELFTYNFPALAFSFYYIHFLTIELMHINYNNLDLFETKSLYYVALTVPRLTMKTKPLSGSLSEIPVCFSLPSADISLAW